MADINALTRENELNKYRNTQLYKDLMAGVVTPEMVQSQMGGDISTGTAIGRGLGQLPGLFMQMGGLKPQKPIQPQATPMDEFQKEYYKQQAKRLADPQDPTQKVVLFNKDTGEFETKEVPTGRVITTENPAAQFDTTGLSVEDRMKGRSLAMRSYKSRGMEKGLQDIYELQKQGYSIDEIEDMITFSRDSDKMSGAFRSAAENIAMRAPASKVDSIKFVIDEALNSGDPQQIKETYKVAALSQLPVAEQSKLMGAERTVEFLAEIKDDLETLQQNGIDTNIFSGTAEDVAAKLGTVREPELRRMATKIASAIQRWRNDMTGKAFSIPETAEYKAMFPGIDKTANFNMANIKALQEVLTGEIAYRYSAVMGKGNYDKIFKNDVKQKESQEDPYQKYLQARGQI